MTEVYNGTSRIMTEVGAGAIRMMMVCGAIKVL